MNHGVAHRDADGNLDVGVDANVDVQVTSMCGCTDEQMLV